MPPWARKRPEWFEAEVGGDLRHGTTSRSSRATEASRAGETSLARGSAAGTSTPCRFDGRRHTGGRSTRSHGKLMRCGRPIAAAGADGTRLPIGSGPSRTRRRSFDRRGKGQASGTCLTGDPASGGIRSRVGALAGARFRQSVGGLGRAVEGPSASPRRGSRSTGCPDVYPWVRDGRPGVG